MSAIRIPHHDDCTVCQCALWESEFVAAILHLQNEKGSRVVHLFHEECITAYVLSELGKKMAPKCPNDKEFFSWTDVQLFATSSLHEEGMAEIIGKRFATNPQVVRRLATPIFDGRKNAFQKDQLQHLEIEFASDAFFQQDPQAILKEVKRMIPLIDSILNRSLGRKEEGFPTKEMACCFGGAVRMAKKKLQDWEQTCKALPHWAQTISETQKKTRQEREGMCQLYINDLHQIEALRDSARLNAIPYWRVISDYLTQLLSKGSSLLEA